MIAVGLLAVAFALGTFGFGWWAVPVIGLVWGVFGSKKRPGLTAAAAAALGWGAMLLSSAIGAPVFVLAGKVGAVMGLPGIGLVGVTLVLAAALGGLCAAVLASTVVPRATGRQANESPSLMTSNKASGFTQP